MLAGGPGNPINTGESQGNQASPSIPTIQNGPIQWITQPRNHTRCLLSSRSALDQNSSASASRAIARACARRRSTRRAADALRPETSASPRKAPQSKPGRRREAERVPYGERPRPVGLPLCVNFPRIAVREAGDVQRFGDEVAAAGEARMILSPTGLDYAASRGNCDLAMW